tara:strand:- start:868 stop:3801 length:2934 start_codon:yes stop_codon:yes gene_type:complete
MFGLKRRTHARKDNDWAEPWAQKFDSMVTEVGKMRMVKSHVEIYNKNHPGKPILERIDYIFPCVKVQRCTKREDIAIKDITGDIDPEITDSGFKNMLVARESTRARMCHPLTVALILLMVSIPALVLQLVAVHKQGEELHMMVASYMNDSTNMLTAVCPIDTEQLRKERIHLHNVSAQLRDIPKNVSAVFDSEHNIRTSDYQKIHTETFLSHNLGACDLSIPEVERQRYTRDVEKTYASSCHVFFAALQCADKIVVGRQGIKDTKKVEAAQEMRGMLSDAVRDSRALSLSGVKQQMPSPPPSLPPPPPQTLSSAVAANASLPDTAVGGGVPTNEYASTISLGVMEVQLIVAANLLKHTECRNFDTCSQIYKTQSQRPAYQGGKDGLEDEQLRLANILPIYESVDLLNTSVTCPQMIFYGGTRMQDVWPIASVYGNRDEQVSKLYFNTDNNINILLSQCVSTHRFRSSPSKDFFGMKSRESDTDSSNFEAPAKVSSTKLGWAVGVGVVVGIALGASVGFIVGDGDGNGFTRIVLPVIFAAVTGTGFGLVIGFDTGVSVLWNPCGEIVMDNVNDLLQWELKAATLRYLFAVLLPSYPSLMISSMNICFGFFLLVAALVKCVPMTWYYRDAIKDVPKIMNEKGTAGSLTQLILGEKFTVPQYSVDYVHSGSTILWLLYFVLQMSAWFMIDKPVPWQCEAYTDKSTGGIQQLPSNGWQSNSDVLKMQVATLILQLVLVALLAVTLGRRFGQVFVKRNNVIGGFGPPSQGKMLRWVMIAGLCVFTLLVAATATRPFQVAKSLQCNLQETHSFGPERRDTSIVADELGGLLKTSTTQSILTAMIAAQMMAMMTSRCIYAPAAHEEARSYEWCTGFSLLWALVGTLMLLGTLIPLLYFAGLEADNEEGSTPIFFSVAWQRYFDPGYNVGDHHYTWMGIVGVSAAICVYLAVGTCYMLRIHVLEAGSSGKTLFYLAQKESEGVGM